MPMLTIRRTAALLAAGALTVLPLLPASAHDELTAVSPEPGSVLTSAPEELELTFSGVVMDIGHQILVTDSEGRSVTEGPLEPQGNRIIQPLTGGGTDDETYRVVWRVVSSDGHPIEGTFTYDVGSGLEPTGDPSPAVEDSAEDAADRASSGNVPLWLVAVAGGAVALAVLGLVSLVSSRRRKG